jgi:sec-independent protein translocase protein TatA
MTPMCPPLAILDPSPTTLLVLGIIAVLLFGERLPEVAKSVGKWFMEFKRGMRDIEMNIHQTINSIDSPSQYKASNPADAPPPEDREEATAPKFEPPVQ